MVHVVLRRITAKYQIQMSDENTCIHGYTDRVTNITVESWNVGCALFSQYKLHYVRHDTYTLVTWYCVIY